MTNPVSAKPSYCGYREDPDGTIHPINIPALEAENALRSQQIDALQAALESECERNRQREEELLGRLAEAERHVAALCGELYDMSMVVKLLIPRGCDDIDAERALKQFMQRYPDGPVAPPAAQPQIEPQPPTAGEE